MKREWFPRVRRGLLKLDPWGKAMCRHSLFVSLNHHLSFLLLGGTAIGWKENHHHAHSCTHSPRCAFWVADGLPTRLITSLFISSHASRDKRFHVPSIWGFTSPFTHLLANRRKVLPLVQSGSLCFRPLHCQTVKRCRDYSLWGFFLWFSDWYVFPMFT